jgi:hypothetical protein
MLLSVLEFSLEFSLSLSTVYAGMGNVSHYRFLTRYKADSIQGAKAQQKRDRNLEKNAPKGAKSQAKSNEAAKKIVCAICKQPFVSSFLFLFAQC